MRTSVSWPPPDLGHVLDSVDLKDLRKELGRLTGETPRTRGLALKTAAQARDAGRKLYEQYRLTSPRPGVTWFRHPAAPPEPRHLPFPHLRRIGEEITDSKVAIVWAETGDEGTLLRLAYVLTTDYPPPSFEPRQRLGFATVFWRRIGEMEVMELHCRSTAYGHLLGQMIEVVGQGGVEVLDFRTNDRVDEIRRRMEARLSEGVGQNEEMDSPVDLVRVTARPGEDLASKGAPFGPDGQYTDYRGVGRLCETNTLKFRLSQRDYSVVFYHPVTFEQTAEVFEVAASVGTWSSFREPEPEAE